MLEINATLCFCTRKVVENCKGCFTYVSEISYLLPRLFDTVFSLPSMNSSILICDVGVRQTIRRHVSVSRRGVLDFKALRKRLRASLAGELEEVI